MASDCNVVFILLKWHALFIKFMWWDHLEGSFQFVFKNSISLGDYECLAAWWVQMAWHILVQGHLKLWVWCGAKPFATFGCYVVLGHAFWGLWMIGSLVGTDDLAYLDARPSAALSWTWWQAINKPRLLCCIGPGILRVVNVWLPGRCRWLGIFDARPSPAMN